jgi:retinol dehydrogenase 12
MTFLGFIYRQLSFKAPLPPSSLNLAGQTIMVTGANTGIGLEAVKLFCKYGASRIILVSRSLANGEDAKQQVLRANPSQKCDIEVWGLDMNSFESVIAFGKRAQALDRLDVAVLNAGVFKFDWTTSSVTGIETQLQVNHLSTALLSSLLLPVLQKTSRNIHKPSRLTFTSSEVHMWTAFEERKAPNILDRLNEKSYFKDAMDRYSVTKLLGVFWARELASRVAASEVIINLVNPGSVNSGLHRDPAGKMVQIFDRVIGRSTAQAALLLVDAAVVKAGDTHGWYLSECQKVKLVTLIAFVLTSY